MSEQQEWTPERLAQYANPDHSDLNQLSSAINAALAAERKRREQMEENGSRYHEADLHEMAQLREHNRKLEHQLLSAQAAIEKIKQSDALTVGIMQIVDSVDLSALRQHDAEVRKPLVEALQKIAESDGIGGYDLANIAADALAKVNK